MEESDNRLIEDPVVFARSLISLSGLQVSASEVLQETCNYIRSLRREVDDLSDRFSDLLAAS